MPCIGPDGKPTESGIRILRALETGPRSAEEVAQSTGMPLFRVRSGFRQLTQAGFANQKDDRCEITEKGAELIR
jgi:DNA-binding IclR family transcriptional regulator